MKKRVHKKYLNMFKNAVFSIYDYDAEYERVKENKVVKPIKGSIIKSKQMNKILSYDGTEDNISHVKNNKYYIFVYFDYEEYHVTEAIKVNNKSKINSLDIKIYP